jgi:anti-sigma B factor antagonist
MPEQTNHMIVQKQNDITIVELMDKKILDEASIGRLTDELNQITDQDKSPRLILDFVNVAHMSSSALSMLISLHKKVKDKKGLLRLCNIKPTIFEVFKITRLNEVFGISETRDDAVHDVLKGK